MPSMRRSNGPSSGVWRTIRTGTGVSRKSASPGRPSAISSTSCPRRRERLGDLDRVHDPAARLDRVGEHRDPHATARLRQPGRRRVGGRDDHARGCAGSPPGGRRAAGLVGAADVGDHRDARGELGERLGEPARGVRVRAVADHDVEQDAAEAVALGGLLEEPQAHLEVDHRVRAALRVLLLPQVEDRVLGAVVAVARVAADRAEHGLEDRHRLVGERAAGVEAEQGAAAAAGVHLGLERVDVRRFDVGGRERARVERRRGSRTARRGSPSRRTRRRPACR